MRKVILGDEEHPDYPGEKGSRHRIEVTGTAERPVYTLVRN